MLQVSPISREHHHSQAIGPLLALQGLLHTCLKSRPLSDESPYQELQSLYVEMTEHLQGLFKGPRSSEAELVSGPRPPVCQSPLFSFQSLPSQGPSVPPATSILGKYGSVFLTWSILPRCQTRTSIWIQACLTVWRIQFCSLDSNSDTVGAIFLLGFFVWIGFWWFVFC